MARRLLLLLVVVAAVVVAGCSHHTPPPLTTSPLASPAATTAAPRVEATPAATAAKESPAAMAKGDPSKGKAIFESVASPACTSCHATDDSRIVGPGLKGMAGQAASRKPGMGAGDYIRESILAPDAYVVTGFPPGVMPKTYPGQLSPQQVDDLVAYLETL